MYDNFLFRAKRTVYKWWCIVYKPVYKLIHNGEWSEEKEPDVKYAVPKSPSQPASLDAQALADAVLDTNRQSQHNIDDLVSEAAHMSAAAAVTKPTAAAPEPALSNTESVLNPEEIPADVDDDVLARANEIMARLNREAAEDEEKKQREIQAAKEKAAEQERLAAILKSTERNIDAFIQEGLSKQHQQDDGN